MVMLWYSSEIAETPSCLYFAGVSRYPAVDASVVVGLGSANEGSQPRFLDKGAGERDGDGRGRVIFCKALRLDFLCEP